MRDEEPDEIKIFSKEEIQTNKDHKTKSWVYEETEEKRRRSYIQ